MPQALASFWRTDKKGQKSHNWRLRALTVRALRIFLPVLAFILLGALVFWTSGQRQGDVALLAQEDIKSYETSLPTPISAQDKAWDNVLISPRFESKDNAGRPFIVTAARALQDAGQDKPVLLEKPKARVTLEGGGAMDITAALGHYDALQRRLRLFEDVTIILAPQGHTLRTAALTFDMSTRMASGKDDVHVTGPGVVVTAKGLSGDLEKGLLTFFGPGEALLTSKDGKSITVIAQDALEWHRTQTRFVARGHARATQAGDKPLTITAEILEAFYTSQTKQSHQDEMGDITLTALTAKGRVVLTSQDTRAQGDQAHYDINSGVAKMTGGDLRITDSDGQTLTAHDAFTYNSKAGLFVADGDVLFTRTSGEWVSAPHMEALLEKEDDDVQGAAKISTITASGGVVAVQDDTRIEAPNAVLDAKTGKVTMLGGRTRAVLYPEEGQGPL